MHDVRERRAAADRPSAANVTRSPWYFYSDKTGSGDTLVLKGTTSGDDRKCPVSGKNQKGR